MGGTRWSHRCNKGVSGSWCGRGCYCCSSGKLFLVNVFVVSLSFLLYHDAVVCYFIMMHHCGSVQHGMTPLHSAAQGGHTRAVQALVAAGANVAAATEDVR